MLVFYRKVFTKNLINMQVSNLSRDRKWFKTLIYASCLLVPNCTNAYNLLARIPPNGTVISTKVMCTCMDHTPTANRLCPLEWWRHFGLWRRQTPQFSIPPCANNENWLLTSKRLTKSRAGVVALYTPCVMDSAWSQSIGNGHFQHLAELLKSLNRSKQKFVEPIMSAIPPSRRKFIMSGGGSRLPIWVQKLSTGAGFFLVFCSQAHSRPRALQSHIISFNSTRLRPRTCLSESHLPTGELFPKNRSFLGCQWGFPA
jgi:hypothetical protein